MVKQKNDIESSVGDNLTAERANWRFDGIVAEGFDEHAKRSIPFYHQGHELIERLSDFFVYDDSVCYDLGCATGRLTRNLAAYNRHKAGTLFVGVDVSNDMITRAQELQTEVNENLMFVVDDALKMEFEPSDFMVSYYTLQFVRPSEKQRYVDHIFSSLRWGGALVLFEKVRACDARFQDMMTSLYADFKSEQGYSAEEQAAKSRSLKGVLEPFSSQANKDMLYRAGFTDVMTVFKYVCFEGFLAIK